MARWFAALGEMLSGGVDAVSLHDPELIPAGLLVRTLRGKPVVVDVHEDVPAQILTKQRVPAPMREPLSAFSRWWLMLAERYAEVTLAEEGYRKLFSEEHPVFPNYPDATLPAGHGADPDGPVVYVGDVQEARGAVDLVEAAGDASVGEVVFVGRCSPELADRLRITGESGGVIVDVRGWLPYREAMAVAAVASVGVSPLRDEPNYRHSLPTKTLEYLSLGVPVIASDLPGTRAVIGELAGAVLVPPSDRKALARTLAAVDDELRTAAAEGAAAVRERFQWPAEQVRSYYDSLLPG